MSKLIDLTGRRFGGWTVLRYKGHQKWLCRCDCGREGEVSGYNLLHCLSQSCRQPGCNDIDLVGQKFNRLLVESFAWKDKQGRPYWHCRCICGTRKPVRGDHLTSGKTTSCGCYRRELKMIHGHTGSGRKPTSEYSSWEHAKARCFSPSFKQRKDYGGRGITMCAGWRNDFVAFMRDMRGCPPGYTLDRYPNNDGNYSCGKCSQCIESDWPMNCRWATRSQQQHNRRKSSQTSSVQMVFP